MRTLPVLDTFAHAARSTLNNLRFAFHASWPWMAVLFPIMFLGTYYNTFVQPMNPTQPPAPGNVVALLAMGAASVVAFASIAVMWHRYILLDEMPRGIQRLRLDSTVWRYIGNILLIGLILGLATFPVALVFSLLGAASGIPQLIFLSAILVPWIMALSYRFCIKLPAIALEKQDFGLRDALRVSAGNFWRFVGLAVLVLLVIFAAGFLLQAVSFGIAALIGDSAAAALVIVDLGVNWVTTIFNITILTSLYGYFVEERNF